MLDYYLLVLRAVTGGRNTPGRRELQDLFEVAFCDFMRWLCGYGLWGGPAECWTLRRADEIMNKWDGGRVLSEEEYRVKILPGKG